MSVNNVGNIFRFITPIMIIVFGWIGQQYFSNLEKHFDKMDIKLDSFTEKLSQEEKRLDKLEYIVVDKYAEKNR